MLEKNVYKRITLANILKHEALEPVHQQIMREYFPEKVAKEAIDTSAKKKAKHNGKSISMTDNYISGVYKQNMLRHSNHRTITRQTSNVPRVVSSSNKINNVLGNSKSVKNIYEFKRSFNRKLTTGNLLYNQEAKPKHVRVPKNESHSVELGLKIKQRPKLNLEQSQKKIENSNIRNYLSMDKSRVQLRLASPEIGAQNSRNWSRKKWKEPEIDTKQKKNTLKIFGKMKMDTTPKFLKRPNQEIIKKSKIRNQSKRTGKVKKQNNSIQEFFKPKIIKRKRKGVSKEKIINGKMGRVGAFNENRMFQTAQIYKSKRITSDKQINLKANLGENSSKMNWKMKHETRGAKDKIKIIQSMQNFYPKRTSFYETPQKLNSPKVDMLKLNSKILYQELNSGAGQMANLNQKKLKKQTIFKEADLAKNLNKREFSKPKIIQNEPDCMFKLANFSKTVKMKLKTDAKELRNSEEWKEVFLKKDQRKTVKKSNLKKQKMKPNLPRNAKVKQRSNFSKKGPRERGKRKMDFHARLREMNKIRNSNKFSIYEEYLKKMKSEINKISLKTYYKIPQECKDFRKMRKA